jgi:6-phosphogluconolactonase (cycloisomerase 2 family)
MRSIALVLGLLAAFAVVATAGAARPDARKGFVYTLSNSPAGNAVLAFPRAADGTLGSPVPYPTGGTGTGGGLGSQEALVLSENGRDLYAVNAGSNSISLFSVGKGGLELESTVPSGGTMPISIALRRDVVYVLNAGGGGNITGFTSDDDTLVPIPGSTRTLGVGSSGPAQVSFTPDGHALVVTLKASSSIATFALDHDVPDAAAVFAAAGGTPFGFDWDRRGHLLTSDAAGSASSYDVSREGRVNVISGAVAAHQAAPCWLVVSRDGKWAYTANGGSGTISGFAVAKDGSLTLRDPSGVTADLGATSHPLDLSISSDGKLLYNLTDGAQSLSAFWVGDDGSLTPAGTTPGLPVGAAGIAAS